LHTIQVHPLFSAAAADTPVSAVFFAGDGSLNHIKLVFTTQRILREEHQKITPSIVVEVS